MKKISRLSTCLWFDGNGEDAANYYVSLIEGSKITGVTRCGDAGPGPKGSTLVVTFELAGQNFMVLNGGPRFKLTEAASISVECETQAEIDRLWDALLDGGTALYCGWLRDRFGLCWQICPARMADLIDGKDAAGSVRAMQAMMGMVKLDMAALHKAYDGN
jgi:predicted 3-demethylubiquinone-9 3-methyltransferase (glyoxalase superfamily)